MSIETLGGMSAALNAEFRQLESLAHGEERVRFALQSVNEARAELGMPPLAIR